jgi:hypothetical protein
MAKNNFVEVNLNHDVWVKLTDGGKAEHRRQYENFAEEWPELGVEYNPPEETDGWSRWQLWCLMQTFGPKMCNGCNVPFETTIRIVNKDNE